MSGASVVKILVGECPCSARWIVDQLGGEPIDPGEILVSPAESHPGADASNTAAMPICTAVGIDELNLNICLHLAERKKSGGTPAAKRGPEDHQLM